MQLEPTASEVVQVVVPVKSLGSAPGKSRATIASVAVPLLVSFTVVVAALAPVPIPTQNGVEQNDFVVSLREQKQWADPRPNMKPRKSTHALSS